MILTCPNCGARYKLRDDAIPAGGRTVRCKACANSWHAEPPVWDLPEALPPGPVPEDAPAAAPPEAPTPPAAADQQPPAEEVPVRRRRWPLLLLLFVGALIASVAALGWAVREGHVHPSQVPGWEWLSAQEIGPIRLPEPAPTKLTLQATAVNRDVPGGGNVWEVSGTITNATEQQLPVPPVEVTLMADGGSELYRWKVDPPVASLAPGKQVRFETATVNTPREASHVKLALRPAAIARP